MNPHLLHHLVEEVFSLGVGAGLEDLLEVIEEVEDVRPVERWEAEVLRLRLQVGPVEETLNSSATFVIGSDHTCW